MAVEFARAVEAGGDDSGELAREFATAVGLTLEPVNQLVAAVLAGGPFSVRRGLQLAEEVVVNGQQRGMGRLGRCSPQRRGCR